MATRVEILGLVDLKIGRRQLQATPAGRALVAALDGVHEGLRDIEQERIAKLVGLGDVGAVAGAAFAAQVVLALCGCA